MKKLTLQDCQSIAKQKEGKCLSKKYKNCDVKMLWECKFNHQWKSRFSSIKQGHWCNICAKNLQKNTIQDCKNIAKKNNGKFLSIEYINANTKYLWECNLKHRWFARYNDIQQGKWCPECAIKNKADKQRGSIEDCHKLAEQNKGKCLSKEYKNNHTKLLWSCQLGHDFLSTYNSVQQGHWCPVCGSLKSAKKSNKCYIINHWLTFESLICIGIYEYSVVKWLNFYNINYMWQNKTFITSIKTAAGKFSTYRPDLYLPDLNLWIEIKGRMYEDAKQKWEWFHKEYPNSELWDYKKLKELGIL